MASQNYQTASETLALLEDRLRRVHYILHGDTPPSEQTAASDSSEDYSQEDNSRSTLPAAERFRKLERNLSKLAQQSPTVSDILSLQEAHPTIFHPTTNPQQPPDLPSTSLAALVLAHAPLYQTSAHQLSTLSSPPNTTIPDPAAFAKLTALQPRIETVRARQEEQIREFAELRARSARLVEQWYEDGVLGMGEKWAGWEERLREGEILVRRREARLKREKEGVV